MRNPNGMSIEEKEYMADQLLDMRDEWIRSTFEEWSKTVKHIERLSPWEIWKAAKKTPRQFHFPVSSAEEKGRS